MTEKKQEANNQCESVGVAVLNVLKRIASPLKRISLRHLYFLLIAIIGLALTTAVIVILWRITTPVETTYIEHRENQFIGAIGVLVAFIGAFMGMITTILFANNIYNNIKTDRRLKELDRHDRKISDLYVLALRTEADIYENDKHFLRAIERRIGVIANVLKSSYYMNQNLLDRHLDKVEEILGILKYNNVNEYYDSHKELIQQSKSKTVRNAKTDILNRIEHILKGNNAEFVEGRLKTIKAELTKKLDSIIAEFVSSEN